MNRYKFPQVFLNYKGLGTLFPRIQREKYNFTQILLGYKSFGTMFPQIQTEEFTQILLGYKGLGTTFPLIQTEKFLVFRRGTSSYFTVLFSNVPLVLSIIDKFLVADITRILRYP